MPRGIAFDRYDVPSGGLPGAPGWKTPENYDGTREALSMVGKVATAVGGALAKEQERQNDLKEKVRVGQAILTASEEMDAKINEIEQNPAGREKAEETFKTWLQDRKSTWTKGLTEEGSLAFQERVVDRVFQGGHRARMIQTKDLQQKTEVTILGFAKRFVEDYVREAPDDQKYETTEDGRTRPVRSRSYQQLEEAYGNAVAAGAMRREEAAKGLMSHEREAALTKAHSLLNANTPAALLRLQTALGAEKERPGSTFLSIVDAKDREALAKMAKDEDFTMLQRAEARIDRAKRIEKESLADQTQEYLRRADKRLEDGTLDNVYIDEGRNAGLIDDDKARFYRTRIEQRASGEEGANHPETFRRLSLDVRSEVLDPHKVKAEVRRAFADRRINEPTLTKWETILDAKITTAKNTAKSDRDDSLKEDRKDVEGLISTIVRQPSLMEKISPQIQALELQLRTEHMMVPRTESSKPWWFANKRRIIEQVEGLANASMQAERGLMLNKLYQSQAEIALNKPAYKARYGDLWEQKYLDDMARMMSIERTRRELQGLKGDAQPGPKPTTGGGKPDAGSKQETAPARGPIKSGVRG